MTPDRILSLTLRAQERMFRLAERDNGLSLKAISLDSGIPYDTIRSYAGHKGSQAMMPVSAVNKLAGVIPDDLLSHLFEPSDRHLAENGDEDFDADALGRETAGFTAEYVDAKSDGVVTPIERSRLRNRARRVARAAGVAA